MIDAVDAMKALYLRMYNDEWKTMHGEGPSIVTTVQFIKGYEKWREMSKQEKRDQLKSLFNLIPS